MVRVLAKWEAEFEASMGDIPVSVWRKERRLRNAGQDSGTRLGHGWRRTTADEQLLSFATRFSVVSVRQAARFFYGGKINTARQRVQKMVEAGLLEREMTLTWAGPIVWPTLDGQRVAMGAGHPLVSSFRPPESQMLHRLLVGERAADLMSAGVEVFSEREIRLIENSGASEWADWLAEKGVVAAPSDGSSPGVVPSVYSEEVGGQMVRRERWLACPTGGVHKTLRFPDLVAVTNTGELQAVEVELAAKETPRMKAIIDGYRDAGVYLRTVKTTDESGQQRAKLAQARRQFRFIDWYGTPPVLRALRGHHGSVHPMTGAPSPGLIRQSYGEAVGDVNGVGDTSRVYRQWVTDSEGRKQLVDCEWSRTGVVQGRPMSARPIPMPDDYGIAWRLHQLTLPDSYKFAFNEWGPWSNLWRKDIAEMGRTEDEVSFTEWIVLDENLRRCQRLTR